MQRLWVIGRHRLVCGDSHDPAVIADALGGLKPGVAVIDPPFDLAGRWTMHLMDPCVVFGTAKIIRQIPEHLWRFERVLVKDWGHRCATTHILHRHALVAQCGTRKRLPRDPRAWDSVVQMPIRYRASQDKPMGLLMEHLALWTPDWEVVFDPYAGSGGTFVVAELLGRRCIGIEREYRRCMGIVRRLRSLL